MSLACRLHHCTRRWSWTESGRVVRDPSPSGFTFLIKRTIIGSLPSSVHCYNVEVLHAGVAVLVDAPDSKSGGARAPCRFEPDLRYSLSPFKTNESSITLATLSCMM